MSAALEYLVDTNVLSEVTRPSPDPGVMSALVRHASVLAISVVTLHELLYGIDRIPPGRRRLRFERLVSDALSLRPILPYDEAASRWHAHERARLVRAGRTIPTEDGQIAAIAATKGLVLVTRNTKHFRPFHGLRLTSWHAS